MKKNNNSIEHQKRIKYHFYSNLKYRANRKTIFRQKVQKSRNQNLSEFAKIPLFEKWTPNGRQAKMSDLQTPLKS